MAFKIDIYILFAKFSPPSPVFFSHNSSFPTVGPSEVSDPSKDSPSSMLIIFTLIRSAAQPSLRKEEGIRTIRSHPKMRNLKGDAFPQWLWGPCLGLPSEIGQINNTYVHIMCHIWFVSFGAYLDHIFPQFSGLHNEPKLKMFQYCMFQHCSVQKTGTQGLFSILTSGAIQFHRLTVRATNSQCSLTFLPWPNTNKHGTILQMDHRCMACLY